MQQCAKHYNNSGFTLIEFMMAIFIISIALMGLLTVVDVSLRHSTSNKMREHAVVLSEEILANYRSMPFANLASENVQRTAQIANFQVTYNIVTVVNAIDTKTRNVSIDVNWTDRGTLKRHTLTTFISNTID